jgi:hypothetical protein
VREIKAYVEAHRTLTTPFDIVLGSGAAEVESAQSRNKVLPFREAGVTWWIEELWSATHESVVERIRQGPPKAE